jgi:hypothetical protein
MNIINIVSLAFGWFILSAIILETGIITIIFLSSFIWCAISLGFVLPIFGLEVVGGNFLFGQFISTAFYLGWIYFFYKTQLVLKWKLLISILVFIFGLYLHASFSLFYFSGTVFYFAYKEIVLINDIKNYINKLIYIIIYGIGGVLFFILHPYTKFATEMKLHNGHLAFTYLTNGPTDISLIGFLFIFASFAISSLIFFYLIFKAYLFLIHVFYIPHFIVYVFLLAHPIVSFSLHFLLPFYPLNLLSNYQNMFHKRFLV